MPRVSRNRRRALTIGSRKGFLRIPRREPEKIPGTRFNSVNFGAIAAGSFGALGAENSKRIASQIIEWCYPSIPGVEKNALRDEISSQIEMHAAETARSGKMVVSLGRAIAGEETGERAEFGEAAQSIMGWLARSDPELRAKPRGFFGGLNVPKLARDYFIIRAKEEIRGQLRVRARDQESARKRIEIMRREIENGKGRNTYPAIWSFELEKDLDFPGAGMRFIYHIGTGKTIIEADALVREESSARGGKGKKEKKKGR